MSLSNLHSLWQTDKAVFVPLFLILVPCLAALAQLFLRGRGRQAVILVASLGMMLGAVSLLGVHFMRGALVYSGAYPWLERAISLIGFATNFYLLGVGLRWGRPVVSLMAALQGLLLFSVECFIKPGIPIRHNLFIDRFSIIMALVVGIAGSLTCVYATGYMHDFHRAHRDVRDRRGLFFFLLLVFMAAMFGIIFTNNLLWLHGFWEVTTICSFLLIAYKGDKVSRANGLNALVFNLAGGLLFAAGVAIAGLKCGTLEMDRIVAMGRGWAMGVVLLLTVAGLIKSAQFPFSSWLLGAMVAPTPVSALLHSSTMVKAGVYLVLRFSTVFLGTLPGLFLSMVGGITFCAASFLAVSARDAKKLLAYSTISNLGLIIMCAGVGTYEAMWAALLLIIFHAAAKGLLFLCVGVIENQLHDRDIEGMDGLILKMPKVSIMVQLGIAGMFLAPFGMLISKWAALKAVIDSNPILVVFLVFGGSASLLFWVKWMGRLITVTASHEEVEEGIPATEWAAMGALAGLTAAACFFFPLISSKLIEPFIMVLYGATATLGHGNLVIMTIMLGLVMLFPLSFLTYGKNVKVVDAYLGGSNADAAAEFVDSLGLARPMAMKNYYFTKYFGEKRLWGPAALLCGLLIAGMFIVAWL